MNWIWFGIGYAFGTIPAIILTALVFGAPVNPFEGYDADKPTE